MAQVCVIVTVSETSGFCSIVICCKFLNLNYTKQYYLFWVKPLRSHLVICWKFQSGHTMEWNVNLPSSMTGKIYHSIPYRKYSIPSSIIFHT